jgi:hypothetical protein
VELKLKRDIRKRWLASWPLIEVEERHLGDRVAQGALTALPLPSHFPPLHTEI